MCVCSVFVVVLVLLVLVLLIMLVVLVVLVKFMSMLIVFVLILLIQRNINSNIISYHRFILRWRLGNLVEAMRGKALLRKAGTGHVRSMRPLYMHMGCIVLLLLVYY